jgi:hypothetical protein
VVEGAKEIYLGLTEANDKSQSTKFKINTRHKYRMRKPALLIFVIKIKTPNIAF